MASRSLILADEKRAFFLNLNTQTNELSCFLMLIASVSCLFFFSPSLSCFNHGGEFRESKHSTCSAEGSSETPRCLWVADADYRFTLWPRKPLIAKADAARHLTIRRGERDDWLAYISVMEHHLYCICVCMCVCVAVWAHNVECVIIIPREKVAALVWQFSSLKCAAYSLRCYYFTSLWLSNGRFQTLYKKLQP